MHFDLLLFKRGFVSTLTADPVGVCGKFYCCESRYISSWGMSVISPVSRLRAIFIINSGILYYCTKSSSWFCIKQRKFCALLLIDQRMHFLFDCWIWTIVKIFLLCLIVHSDEKSQRVIFCLTFHMMRGIICVQNICSCNRIWYSISVCRETEIRIRSGKNSKGIF